MWNGKPVRSEDDRFYVLYVTNGDVFEAEMPTDGGRYSVDFDGTHYFVVDYSSYGQGMQVPETADAIQATVSLELLEDRF